MEDEDQGTHDFRKHLRKTNRSAIEELEARGRATGGTDDEGALNFQVGCGLQIILPGVGFLGNSCRWGLEP